jgi:hypothetical protein
MSLRRLSGSRGRRGDEAGYGLVGSVVGLSESVILDPPTFDILRRTDALALILALHERPVEKRRRVVKGLVGQLI